MLEPAIENLKASVGIILQTNARIANLEAALASTESASPQLADDLASEKENLRRAKEARAICALQILGEVADEQAFELMKLNVRRKELAEALHGFLKMEVSIDGQVQTPATSRMASAALMQQPVEILAESLAAAASRWKDRFDALLADSEVEAVDERI
jgi:hypothetical protein